ncbi:MAG: response regulator, partial [Miltoncostaeaceae bacterium]
TTKEVGRGTGLGLSMVYGFVRQSGGHIVLESEPGAGTRVLLYLPPAEPGAVAREESADTAVAIGDQETILVVEDDHMMRRVVSRQLAGLGYDAILASTGDEALAVLERHPGIALLFTDVVLAGGMNGRELAERAAERRPDLPVLFTSGYTEDAVLTFGRTDAGVDLIAKPYGRAALARRIREILDR